LITNGNEVWEPGFGGDQAGSPGIHWIPLTFPYLCLAQVVLSLVLFSFILSLESFRGQNESFHSLGQHADLLFSDLTSITFQCVSFLISLVLTSSQSQISWWQNLSQITYLHNLRIKPVMCYRVQLTCLLNEWVN
jgi:hypothetical protein